MADGKELELSFLLLSWFFSAVNIRFLFMFEKHILFCCMLLLSQKNFHLHWRNIWCLLLDVTVLKENILSCLFSCFRFIFFHS